jgi:tetratricopeptide (TPR) repeat protein
MTSKNDKGRLGGALARAAVAIAVSVVALGCSRNRQEAVILANQADKEVTVNPDGAINKYDQATKLDPTNHRILHKLAMAQKKKEEWDKVASTMSRATQVAPKFANYWFERGWALEMQARKKTIAWDEAKEPFLKCIENDPNFADCYHEVGNVYLWTDDEQKALEYFTKAIEHDPTEIRYYGPLADLYIRTGYHKEAEGVLKEAKSFAKPGDKYLFGVHSLLAQVYQERGQMTEMISELEAAKAVAPADGPESVLILWSLGSSYAQLNPPRTQEAIQMLKGFNSRACKGAKAQSFRTECESTSALIQKLGGTLQ